MDKVKSVWFTKYNDEYCLCLREFPRNEPWEHLNLFFKTNEFPPSELIGGKRLNIDEAKKLGLSEKHHNLYSFSRNDLLLIREAIDEALRV